MVRDEVRFFNLVGRELVSIFAGLGYEEVSVLDVYLVGVPRVIEVITFNEGSPRLFGVVEHAKEGVLL